MAGPDVAGATGRAGRAPVTLIERGAVVAEILILLAFLGGWILLQAVILPKSGVPT